MSKSTKSWYLYLIKSTNRTYIGISTDPLRRLSQHNKITPGGSKSTSGYSNWVLVATLGVFQNRSAASRWERIIKHRARGLDKRLAAMYSVSLGICPKLRDLPSYEVTDKLTFSKHI